MSNLRAKTVSGIKWSSFSQAGRLITQLITTFILARLLKPADFGLLGMAIVIIGFISIFKDLGTSAAIIQRREVSEELLSTVFWSNLVFGAFASLLLFFLAPLVGRFYEEPRVVAVVQALSTGFFISSFTVLHQALMERSLSFEVLARIEVFSVMAGAMTAILLAILGAGIWSLVGQTLITIGISTFLLWRSSVWKPTREFDLKELVSVSRFSLNLTGFTVFNYFARNADYILIGRYLGAQDLGYYTLAYRILLFPLQNISDVISRVMFPALSSIQNDNTRFGAVYQKAIGVIATITFPLMAGIFILAEPFVLTFFGDTWRPTIQLIMIFAPVGLIHSIGTTVGVIYRAVGRTDWMFRWGIFSGLFYIVAIALGLQSGIVGVAVTYSVAAYLLIYPSFVFPLRLIDLKFKSLLRAVSIPFVNSCFILGMIFILRTYLLPGFDSWLVLLFCTVSGGLVYGFANLINNREQLTRIWAIVWERSHAR